MLQNFPYFWHEFLKETLRKACIMKKEKKLCYFLKHFTISFDQVKLLIFEECCVI